MTYNTDGTHLIVGAGNQLLVYNAEDGSLLNRLKGHKETILCVTSLLNGGVASGGADNTVIIWNQKYQGVLKYTHSHAIQFLQQDPMTGISSYSE